MYHKTITIMRIKRYLITAFAVVVLLTLMSCQSYEEGVIHKLNNLSERIDKDGKNFDADDWEEALEELADIHEDMTDCEFTPEQLKEVGRADGRLSAIITKQAAKALGHEVSDAIKGISSYAKGFKEGAEGNIDEDDFNDVVDEIGSLLKSVGEDWKE